MEAVEGALHTESPQCSPQEEPGGLASSWEFVKGPRVTEEEGKMPPALYQLEAKITCFGNHDLAIRALRSLKAFFHAE